MRSNLGLWNIKNSVCFFASLIVIERKIFKNFLEIINKTVINFSGAGLEAQVSGSIPLPATISENFL